MMLLLLLLGSCTMSIAAPSYNCDPTVVAFVGARRFGQWTDQIRKAACKDVECPIPYTFEGGEYEPHKAKYIVGDVLEFECWEGFTMHGPEKRTCQENGKWSGETTICDDGEKQGGKLNVKTGGLMNIFLIIDASGSVGEENFETAKAIAEIFIEEVSSFDFVPRYSVMTYASKVIRVVSLSEDDINTDADKVIDKIKAFEYSEHDGKRGTNTRAALQEVYNQLSLDYQRNPDKFVLTSNVIVLMTDGKHNMGGDPSVEVKKIKEILGIRKNHQEDKLDIYVFGLGYDVSLEELNGIASKKDTAKHVFKMESIDDLKAAFDEIIDDVEAFEMCGLSKDYSKDTNEQYPWIVKFTVTRPGGVDYCKGSIISKNFILTAAHCFHLDDQPHTVSVKIGGREKRVKNIYRHPKYDPAGKKHKSVPRSFDYNLALVELAQKIDFSSTVRPICLPCTTGTTWALKKRDGNLSCSDHEKMLLTGDLVKALFITEKSKDKLEKMDVQIKQGNQRQSCLADAKKVMAFKDVEDIRDVVTDNFLCTGGLDPVVDPQTCKGDSGGPLIVEYKKRYIQVGVISWGTVNSCEGLKRKRVPAGSRDFHATISQERGWLKEVLKEDLIFLD